MARTGTTQSWWGRAAPGPRPRCCWPARATGCSSSTGRRSRATRSRPTSSTRPGVAALQRWGLLDRLVATGCPPIDTYSFDFGPFTLAGAPGHRGRSGGVLPAPHRARQAARRRGIRGGRRGPRGVHGRGDRRRGRSRRRHPRSRQGRARPSRSAPTWWSAPTAGTRFVAKAVRPEQYNEKPPLLCGYYTYWSGLPMDGRFEVCIRPGPRVRGGADARRADAGRRRLAVRGVRGQQERRRGQLPGDVRPRARVRRADPRRHARGPLRGHGGAELLPPAVRSGLGARRRRRVQQGLHHGAGDPATRSATPSCARPRSTRRSPARARSTTRWASTSPPATSTSCRCSSSRASWRPSSRRRPSCSSCSAPCTATRRRWTGSPA